MAFQGRRTGLRTSEAQAWIMIGVTVLDVYFSQISSVMVRKVSILIVSGYEREVHRTILRSICLEFDISFE